MFKASNYGGAILTVINPVQLETEFDTSNRQFMINPNILVRTVAQALFCSLALSTQAQPSNNVPQADAGFPPADGRPNFDGFPAFGPGGFGPGGPGGHEEKIFEQFHRAHDSLSSGIPGSGLGLTLARQSARAHGGDIIYQPRPGVGSCFILRLPVA